MQTPTKEYGQEVLTLLRAHYPHAKMILEWGNNFELLVAIILSAQCTDKKVNEVTTMLFPKYRQKRKELADEYDKYSRIDLSKEEMIELVNFSFTPLLELEQDIKSTGFYHNKAKSVMGAAKTVLEKFNGILPRSIKELTTIPGVGRKTANVFLGNAYHVYEGIAVDTHVTKQSQALGLSSEKTPEKIEQDLMRLYPQEDWFPLTYLLIEHGRNMRKKKSDRIVCSNSTCVLCNPR